MCVTVSHGGAWRCWYLFCGNQKASQGRLEYFKESHPGSMYSEHMQTKAAVPLLEEPRRFSVACYRVVGLGGLVVRLGWGREAYFVKSNSILGSSSCSR